ncbi:hypothetical protein AQUCO_00201448v1 [Aquilegia coerulea]|uniref:Uncharacterized protein n=1 Tax=Aquilegia coerulea TaxID=218851 RepID=A0A2G5F846_AQUCA|nr:hypothetical protein AQUCO_00201448v1 [Aquilegia coerulea]
MTIVLSSQPKSWQFRVQEDVVVVKKKTHKARYLGFCYLSTGGSILRQTSYFNVCGNTTTRFQPIYSSTIDDGTDPNDSEDEKRNEESSKNDKQGDNNEFREDLERIVGTDDSAFSGIDLATLIRNKYGRSYDVQLIKKEFMGRNLLAMNVMWKYMEQRSFPLTEEEYILRLDDVANLLKCWGAVSHIRSSLAKLKERPRIGKAVSIFIDMDESGGRANEWIYK